jgi:hypothetical protein
MTQNALSPSSKVPEVLTVPTLFKSPNSARRQWPTCNPSNSGGRDQEDCDSKPAQANSFRDPISKTPLTKKGLVEWFLQGEGPEFKPQYCKKKKKVQIQKSLLYRRDFFSVHFHFKREE